MIPDGVLIILQNKGLARRLSLLANGLEMFYVGEGQVRQERQVLHDPCQGRTTPNAERNLRSHFPYIQLSVEIWSAGMYIPQAHLDHFTEDNLEISIILLEFTFFML